MIEVHRTLNARNFNCPKPILLARKVLRELEINQVLEILTTDPESTECIPSWVRTAGHELIVLEKKGQDNFRFLVKRMK